MPRKRRIPQKCPNEFDPQQRLDPSSAGGAILPDGIIRNSFAIGEDIHPGECLRNLQEMFQGKLDADVIHMVLTECEFNVNNALEALFTLLPQDSAAASPGDLLSAATSTFRASSNDLSPSTSSESLAGGENIVTSEAEVHKSSEESERESVLGVDFRCPPPAENPPSTPFFSSLSRYVDAPPFVPCLPQPKASSTDTCASAKPVNVTTGSVSDVLVGHGREGKADTEQPSSSSLSKEQDDLKELMANGEQVLVLIRGLPGSGKSTLAEKIRGRNGVVLSADHFFYRKGMYVFDRMRLSEAHEWNKRRASRAIQDGRSPVVIDNTNIEVWEMMPYVALALRARYRVVVLEPDTPWKFNPKQLTRRNTHGVPRRNIESMLERYDHSVTAESLCRTFGFFPSGPRPESVTASPVTNPTVSRVDHPVPVATESSAGEVVEAAEDSGAYKTAAAEKASTSLETISLQDLMALVQNDSEGSGSGSRQNSDSWSSGQDTNDWEDATEHDDDFLWTASSKSAASRARTGLAVGDALFEEPEIPDSGSEADDIPTEHTIAEDIKLPSIESSPSAQEYADCADTLVDGAPKPQRELPTTKSSGHLPKAENPFLLEKFPEFSEPWEPHEKPAPVDDDTPKPQRSPQRSRQSPRKTSGDRARSSSPVPEVPHTVPRTAESSRQGRSAVRRPIFGLEKVVRSNTWTFPEFAVYEPPPVDPSDVTGVSPEKKDASSATDGSDFALVQKVLTGESDELKVLVGRCPVTDDPPDYEALFPLYRSNTVERSTDTNDLPTNDLDFADRLALLQQCIPGVSSPDLEDIFQRCHGDHVWAADLLLESNVPCDLQPLVIEEDGDAPKPTKASSDSGCDREAIAVADISELSPPVTSGLATPQTAIGMPIPEVLPVAEVPELETSSAIPTVEQALPSSSKLPEKQQGPATASSDVVVNNKGRDSFSEPSVRPRKSVGREFTFTLDHSFACQLVDAFGSEGLHVSLDAFSHQDLSVTIGNDMAKELHRLWMETLRSAMKREEEEIMEMWSAPSVEETMSQARAGAENDRREASPDADSGPLPTLNDDPQWAKAPDEMSFREIMEMEAALEKKRKNWAKNNAYMDMATKLKHKQLYDRFPGVDRQALDDIFVASNYSLIQSISTINETLGMASEEENVEDYERKIVELVALESMRPGDHQDDEWQPAVEGHEDLYDRLQLVGDYDVIRREATVHYHMRQEAFRKAKEAYQRGMKTVAAFYSQQGRAYAQKMREANERASEKLVQLRNAGGDDNSLDLHGLHVQEAIQVLKNFVKLKKREAWCLQKKVVLRIITGRGAHSALNIPKVKFAVEGFLLSSQLNYKEVQAGMFHVML
ncbi:unnamed protein product [Ixodes pacificus]